MSSLQIHRLQPHELSEFKALIALFLEVFEEEQKAIPSDLHLRRLLVNTQFHVFVALHGTRVVGGLTIHELPAYYAEKPELYIYDMAVTADMQRQGIGRQLITAAKEFGVKQGANFLMVEAHAEDAHVLSFYQPLFNRSEKVFLYIDDLAR